MNCAMSVQGFSVTPFTTKAQPGLDILVGGRWCSLERLGEVGGEGDEKRRVR